MRVLTPLQLRWVEAYLHGPTGIRYNMTQAAIVAGYAPRSARNQGSRNARNPRIRTLIDAEVASWRQEWMHRTR